MSFWDDVGNWFTGGKIADSVQAKPQTADLQRSYLQSMLNRQAPMMNTGQADQTRGQQQQLAGMLMQTAQGQRPGAGEMAVNRQANQALAGQTAAASMARGANAALALRNAARNRADIGTNAAGQAAIAQLNDATAAQNQLGGLLGTTRGQDIQTAGANQQSQLAQQQLQLGALAQMLGVDESELRARLAKAGVQMQDTGHLGALLAAAGTVGGAAAGGAFGGPKGAQVGSQAGGQLGQALG